MARPRTQAAPAAKPAVDKLVVSDAPPFPPSGPYGAPEKPAGPTPAAAPETPAVDLDKLREDFYRMGYEVGYREGVAAAAPSAPLFERCKAAVTKNPGLTEHEIAELLADLERDSGERLAPADRDLLLIQHRRAQQLARARADETARPRTRSTEMAPSTSDAPAVTTYEHVS